MSDTRAGGEHATSNAFANLVDEVSAAANASNRELMTATDDSVAAALAVDKPQASSAYVWYIIAGGVVAIFWSAGVFAFTAGKTGLAGLAALPVADMASLVFVTLGPAIFVVLAAVLIAELARFRSTAQTIGAMAARFADPAKATREDSQKMSVAVHNEISKVNIAVEGALSRLGAMEEVLGHHRAAFTATEVSARERTDALINDLRREREAVADLATVLDQKAADIANAITEQSKMVVAAADIANAHSIDSTKLLDQSAERLNSSAHDAVQGVKVIAAKLGDASDRLVNSTIVLGDNNRALDENAAKLDQIQERARTSFAASRDDALALSEITRKSVSEIESVARVGAEVISNTFDEVLQKSQSNLHEAQRETQMATERNARQSEDLKAAAEEAKNALEAYAKVIAQRLEQANEASFNASSWADKTFERLDAAVKGLESKLAALPQAAEAQAQDLQEKLRLGLSDLNAAARLAAEEAEEIDASFQARIRHNYELLSDFMLRMGSAADARGAMDVPSPFMPAARAQTKAAPESVPEVLAPKVKALRKDPGADPEVQTSATHHQAGFSNPEKSEAVKTPKTSKAPEVPKAAGPNEDAGKKGSAWRWKDVLSGMERADDQPALAAKPAVQDSPPSKPVADTAPDPLDRLVTLFRIHDINPPSLFNTQVYRSLSHARLVGGAKAMVDIVRMEVPSHVQALHDAFVDDASLRQAAIMFAQELRGKIDGAAQQQNRLHLETHLRTGDGPAYLLIETALA